MGHHHGHPLTRAMELRPNHWSTTRKSHLETHGFTYWQHTNHIPNKQIILIMHLTPHAILCNSSSFIFHVDFIPSHSSQFGDIELHLIPIPCHQCNIIVHTEFMTTYITNHFIEIHAKIYPRSSFIIHESHHSCKFIHLILYKCIQRHTYITK